MALSDTCPFKKKIYLQPWILAFGGQISHGQSMALIDWILISHWPLSIICFGQLLLTRASNLLSDMKSRAQISLMSKINESVSQNNIKNTHNNMFRFHGLFRDLFKNWKVLFESSGQIQGLFKMTAKIQGIFKIVTTIFKFATSKVNHIVTHGWVALSFVWKINSWRISTSINRSLDHCSI